MKVAFIKQSFDVSGPFASSLRTDEGLGELFKVWPGKATYWEATSVLNADWYVVPTQIKLDYHRDLLDKGEPNFSKFIENQVKKIIRIEDIPFAEYDVVITLDPILRINIPKQTLLTYYINEHLQPIYQRSLRNPVGNYDLFLAHMFDADDVLSRLPQSISFPYLHDPNTVRLMFNQKKDDNMWVDWRMLIALSMENCWSETAILAGKRLKDTLGIPIRYAGEIASSKTVYGISNPPKWEDAADYLANLSRSKYYVSLGRDSGAGQGLIDAASAGCICFGEQDKAYHRLVCHPSCLCRDMSELPHKFRKVYATPNLQNEIMEWQDRMLRKNFIEKPVALLEKAVEMKRNDRK